MSYTVDWERHGVTVRYQGPVDFSSFMAAVLDIHADANYCSLKFVIHDMLQASSLDFSGVDMTALVAHELGARHTNPNVRPAVVSRDAEMGEKTRLFSALTQLNVGVFTSLEAARIWAEGPTRH